MASGLGAYKSQRRPCPRPAPPRPSASQGPAPRSALGGCCRHVRLPRREEGEGITERARARRGRDLRGLAEPPPLKLWLSEDGPCTQLLLALWGSASPTLAPVQGLHVPRPCPPPPRARIDLPCSKHMPYRLRLWARDAMSGKQTPATLPSSTPAAAVRARD